MFLSTNLQGCVWDETTHHRIHERGVIQPQYHSPCPLSLLQESDALTALESRLDILHLASFLVILCWLNRDRERSE